ncbi:DUF3422 family protein [Silicimonas sp. MF1-12-2]|uniref:DUF3422 family protein n=1 Tax=Silicimonas sp. MF1-12-2 TaxID=3384793 RepID=UPI0039B3F4DB
MAPIEDHPLRYALANELHARPFPTLNPPCRAAFLAIKQPTNAGNRDRELDRAHLITLLDRYGAQHPQPGATHYFGQIGKHQLKWECHTEFVTYTIFGDGVAETPFDASTFNMFPEDWLSDAPGVRITSALIRVEKFESEEAVSEKVDRWFVSDSLAVSKVLDDSGIMAGDFRIDEGGHMRFALFVRPKVGPQRVGRVVQRLCEIETYKTMSMLGFSRARELGPQIGAIDRELTELISNMSGDSSRPEETLASLLDVSSRLEDILAKSSFRFGATGAYETLVNQRISVLREERFFGRQTFAEFMTRRFDPAMRTVKATEGQLRSMAERGGRAADLLRTRVDVDRSAQNQALLESMDKRADLQLRLQRTVEGLSVVAISYYAVNLATYLAYPLTDPLGVSKGVATAVLTPIVILGVWFMVRKIRKSLH